MLALNLERILKLRGISEPFAWLSQNGFKNDSAHRILNNKVSHIKMEHLEKLCLLLNCTPNDLMEWKAGANEQQTKQHALAALIRNDDAHLHSFLKNASLEELGKVQEFIAQLKEKAQ